MGLREKLEDTDFARGIKITLAIAKDEAKKSSNMTKVLSSFLIPAEIVVTYLCCKYDKTRDRSFYEEFYCDPHSSRYILN
ncbi:hypothetical protein K8R30_01005 [archaeon]|nr:hypothetical protein [archaeon]